MKLQRLERTSECRKCGAPIGFVRTFKGAWMPVEPEPTILEKIELGKAMIDEEGVVWKRRDAEANPSHWKMEGYACHFDTCKG